MLYILLFNQNPFESLHEVIEKPLKFPFSVRHGLFFLILLQALTFSFISAACKNLLLAMLEKDPSKRATMDHVAAHEWLKYDE